MDQLQALMKPLALWLSELESGGFSVKLDEDRLILSCVNNLELARGLLLRWSS